MHFYTNPFFFNRTGRAEKSGARTGCFEFDSRAAPRNLFRLCTASQEKSCASYRRRSNVNVTSLTSKPTGTAQDSSGQLKLQFTTTKQQSKQKMSAENATVCDCLEAGVSRLKAKTRCSGPSGARARDM